MLKYLNFLTKSSLYHYAYFNIFFYTFFMRLFNLFIHLEYIFELIRLQCK